MTQGTNAGGRPAYKRNKARHRPVLVTSKDEMDPVSDEPVKDDLATTTEPVSEQPPVQARARRGLPKFFSTVGKKEETSTDSTVDPAAARIARATRNKAPQAKEVKESKEAKKAEARPAPKGTPVRPPARSGFKTRYIFGMVLYLIIADFVGLFERSWLLSAKADRLLFAIGPVQVYTSTLLFLATLVVILIVLARFDLIPRSLGAMSGSSSARSNNKTSTSQSNAGAAKASPPVMKQGVKGADDDLYQEYRETRRYLQRRERKK